MWEELGFYEGFALMWKAIYEKQNRADEYVLVPINNNCNWKLSSSLVVRRTILNDCLIWFPSFQWPTHLTPMTQIIRNSFAKFVRDIKSFALRSVFDRVCGTPIDHKSAMGLRMRRFLSPWMIVRKKLWYGKSAMELREQWMAMHSISEASRDWKQSAYISLHGISSVGDNSSSFSSSNVLGTNKCLFQKE